MKYWSTSKEIETGTVLELRLAAQPKERVHLATLAKALVDCRSTQLKGFRYFPDENLFHAGISKDSEATMLVVFQLFGEPCVSNEQDCLETIMDFFTGATPLPEFTKSPLGA